MDVKPRTRGRADAKLPAAAADSVSCWCGAADLAPLGSVYARCLSCGTVIYKQPVDPAEYTAVDGTGFYGDRYWRRHVPRVLGLPGLEARARTDLPERAVFHLLKILDYLRPGCRVLELGCGAGSLTYLLAQAGFVAEGLELGPAAIEVATDRFGVDVHRGPLEALGDIGPYDAIVAIDVLEHLPDPLATMSLCVRRLTDDGLIFLQTPCYRGEGPEWEMLLPKEHLHLFNEVSIERLLRAAGLGTIQVGGSLFPHDMWVTAAVDGALIKRAEPVAEVSPIAVALIDAYTENVRARGERDAIDVDRKQKEQVNESLGSELESVRGDQIAKQRLLGQQDEELGQLRVDQRAKDELIARLDGDLETVRHHQTAKAGLIDRLSSQLEAMRDDQSSKEELIEQTALELESLRTDQSAKAELIDHLTSELESLRTDQSAKTELIDHLTSELESLRADQSAKAGLIDHLTSELEAVRGDQQAKELVIRQLDAELKEARVALDRIHSDRIYRFLRAMRVPPGGRG